MKKIQNNAFLVLILLLLVSIALISCDLSSESDIRTNTVTFNTNGGTTVADQTVTEGDTAVEPTDPTKDGYTFAGWYSDEIFTTEFDFLTAIDSDITLYASWILNAEDTVVITLTNKEDGNDTLTYTLTNGGSYNDGEGGFHLFGIDTTPETGEEDVPMIAVDIESFMGEADNDSGFIASNEPVIYNANYNSIEPEDATYPDFQYMQSSIIDTGAVIVVDTAYGFNFYFEAYNNDGTDSDEFGGTMNIVFSSVGSEGNSFTGVIAGEVEGTLIGEVGTVTYEIEVDFNVLHAYKLD